MEGVKEIEMFYAPVWEDIWDMEKTGEQNIEKMRETYLQNAIKAERENRIAAVKRKEKKIRDDIRKK